MKYVKPVLQYDVVECGAASLSAILAYYGKYKSISELRDVCGVSRDGSNALNLLKAARTQGMEARGFRIPADQLTDDKLPCIIFWNFNHFLILEGFKNGRAYLSDPSQGRWSLPASEFLKFYTGVALVIKPGPEFKKSGAPTNLLKEIFRVPFYYPKITLVNLAIGVIGIVPTLFLSSSTSEFVNSFLSKQRAYYGMPIVILILLAIIFIFASSNISSAIARRLQFNLSRRYSAAIFSKLFEANYKFIAQRSASELSSRMTLGLVYSQSVISIIYSYGTTLLQAAIVLFAVFLISWPLTLLTLFGTMLNMYFTNRQIAGTADDNKKLAMDQGLLYSKGLLSIVDIETVKSTGMESSSLNSWMDYFVPVNQTSQELGIKQTNLSTLSFASTLFLDIGSILLGGYLILVGEFTVGGLLAFQFLSSILQAPITALVQLGPAMQSLEGVIGRVQDINGSDKDPNVRSLVANLDSTFGILPQDSSLEIRNINFKFSLYEDYFFKDLSMIIPEKSHTTIVGPSGSGKSTLLKIISGLIEPESGNIYVGKLKIQEIDTDYFRKFLGYIPQDVMLFDTDFYDNIALWDTRIPKEQIYSSCQDAEIESKILEYAESYSKRLGSFGSILSGGQKQRLTIARSLARNPSILILDEATSALDDATEQAVLNNIRSRQITTITVAHRLYSALSSDYVYVMDGGKVIESGPPSKLLQMNGAFNKMVELEKVSQ